MNPLAIAVQGLGFTAALVAVQGFLALVVAEITRQDNAGGGLKTRRRIQSRPLWLPNIATNDDEDAMLLIGLI